MEGGAPFEGTQSPERPRGEEGGFRDQKKVSRGGKGNY